METQRQPTIPGYELGRATPEQARESLARVVGRCTAAVVWNDACREAGVEITPEQFERVAACLARQPGAVGIVGKSYAVRLRTYNLLSHERRAERPEKEDHT